jgi:hypothetical protein
MITSAMPSPLTSPMAVSVPKPSPASEPPGTPVLFCVMVFLREVTGPLALPGTVTISPAPESAFGTPRIMSPVPSWL